jgi:beta-glucosidase
MPPRRCPDLPAYDYWSEGLHGFARDGIATVFPQAMALAATWDVDLLHRVGDVVSTEARAHYNAKAQKADRRRFGGLHIWSPNVNIFRDPRWGADRRPMARIPISPGGWASPLCRAFRAPTRPIPRPSPHPSISRSIPGRRPGAIVSMSMCRRAIWPKPIRPPSARR